MKSVLQHYSKKVLFLQHNLATVLVIELDWCLPVMVTAVSQHGSNVQIVICLRGQEHVREDMWLRGGAGGRGVEWCAAGVCETETK